MLLRTFGARKKCGKYGQKTLDEFDKVDKLLNNSGIGQAVAGLELAEFYPTIGSYSL